MSEISEEFSQWGPRSVLVFATDDGARLTWSTHPGAAGLRTEQPDTSDSEEMVSRCTIPGDRVRLRCTVKRHGEYRGDPQTEIQRGKVLKLIIPAPEVRVIRR